VRATDDWRGPDEGESIDGRDGVVAPRPRLRYRFAE
jgi:hypothetical protein